MTVCGLVCPLSIEQTLSNNPIDELENHPAYYPKSTKKHAENLLLGTQPMTYVLWTMQGINAGAKQYWLSYVTANMTVEHVTFDYINDWTMNCHHAAALSDLIPQIMECRSNECKMLLNPSHYRT